MECGVVDVAKPVMNGQQTARGLRASRKVHTSSCEMGSTEARESGVVSVDTARRNNGPNEWSKNCIEHPTLLSF